MLPTAIEPESNLRGTTRFAFPFDSPKKLKDEAYRDVENGFRELAETSLLFLSHLQSVGWKTGAGASGWIMRIQHSDHHFEVLKGDCTKPTSSLHFLKFDEPVSGLEKQYVAIAFALEQMPTVQRSDREVPLAEQFRIVESRGSVAVYFPAEKETSGLRFHLHAPFVLELSRASVRCRNGPGAHGVAERGGCP